MRTIAAGGLSFSWGGRDKSRGILFNAFNIVNLNLLVSTKIGVHLQAGIGVWRLDTTLGLGWADKKGTDEPSQ